MSHSERLKSITGRVTPVLEAVLATDSLTSAIPESLQLRYTQCGLATAGLQGYLLEKHGIRSDRLISTLSKAPLYNDFTPMQHVVLKSEDSIIDPTYGQFFNFIGLDTKSAQDNNLIHLYPTPKIMVFPTAKYADFADTYARHAFRLDQQKMIPKPLVENAPDGQLRGQSLDKMQQVYRSIWNPADYLPFPVKAQHSDYQKAVDRIIESLVMLG